MQTVPLQSRQWRLVLPLLPVAKQGRQPASPVARGSRMRECLQAGQHQRLRQAAGQQEAALLPALLVLCLRTVLLCQGCAWAAGPPALMTQETRPAKMGPAAA